jgi:hypothetical protein
MAHTGIRCSRCMKGWALPKGVYCGMEWFECPSCGKQVAFALAVKAGEQDGHDRYKTKFVAPAGPIATLTAAVCILISALVGSPPASAADLSLQTHRARVVYVRHVRHRLRVAFVSRAVRDYDGTPVVFRPYRPMITIGPDGERIVVTSFEAVPVPRASPRYYSNGEPVLPNYPRNWPRVATLGYQMMHGQRY